MNYKKLLVEIYNEVQDLNLKGKTADYIPELSNIDINKFGLSLVTVSGEIFSVGDACEKFSIQSISKVLTLAMVYPKLDEKLWQRVGVEPSGSSFNSLAQLEWENGIPRNPLINAGALVVTDIIRSLYENPVAEILSFLNKITQSASITYNEKMAESEINHSSRNKALAHFMKSFANIESNVFKLIETYCYQCAIEMTCEELAKAFLLFANHGKNIYTNEQLLTLSQAKRINAITQTCGFYDEAGEFAYKVGLPGKSGVGGGIAAVLPGKFSVVVWSPGLNDKGNSSKGMKALELLTTKLGYSIF
ncbi:MAG: glutaminase [Salinivirgaceae bacterium]|nr:glutaminase [Salinivirgaceae bacterium]